VTTPQPRFSETVVKTLFAFSNNCCGFIDIDTGFGCEEKMTDPAWYQVNGEIAHIRGWAPHSARYDPSMTDEERNAFPNLLLLCPLHHKLVDRLEPGRYTVAMLEEMKEKGGSASTAGTDWADDATLSTFARDAIRQAVARLVGEMETENEGLTADSPTGTLGAGIIVSSAAVRRAAERGRR
jgi:hypothetical protein